MKRFLLLLIAAASLASCSKDNSSGSTANYYGGNGGYSGTGQGGSLARFTIASGHLYVVDNMKLYAYALTDAKNPQLQSSMDVGMNIETIYTFKDKLFIGSQAAMYVYSISDAAHPVQLGMASHVRACDPVVANDKYAYVTVRAGNQCGGFANALIVYDVTDPLVPTQVNTINMNSPYGLGMKGNSLFVCDGIAGLDIYNISTPTQPVKSAHIDGETFYDVIIADDLLICMIEGGTTLYQIGSDNGLTFLSKITN